MASIALSRNGAPTDWVRRVSILLILGIVFVPYIFVWFLLRRGYSATARAIGFIWTAFVVLLLAFGFPSPPKAQTPEQRAAAEKSKRRDVNIVTYTRSLKATLRNPDSLVIEAALANDDGTLVCFKYRGQNGFGGTNREWVAFTPAGGGQDAQVVRTICRDKDMRDVTYRTTKLLEVLG